MNEDSKSRKKENIVLEPWYYGQSFKFVFSVCSVTVLQKQILFCSLSLSQWSMFPKCPVVGNRRPGSNVHVNVLFAAWHLVEHLGTESFFKIMFWFGRLEFWDDIYDPDGLRKKLPSLSELSIPQKGKIVIIWGQLGKSDAKVTRKYIREYAFIMQYH